jgi:hypothetical protein
MSTEEEMNASSASLPDECDDQIPDPETQRSRMENDKVEDESKRVAADIEENGSGVEYMRADSVKSGPDEPDDEEDNQLQPQSESEIEGTQEEDDFVSTSADDASDSENRYDQKVLSSSSLLGENSSKDMKTKKKKKKEKKKKEKKGTKKKKGGRSKEEYSSNEDNRMQNESKDRSDDHDGSAALDGTRFKGRTDDGDHDEENQKISAMMVSLRKAEKARVNPFIYNQNDYDSDNDGMWNVFDQDSTQSDNGNEKKKRKKVKKRRHKMEWESSIVADDTTSVLVDPRENSDTEITFEDCKSPAPRSTGSLFSPSSNYSDNGDTSTRSRSAHSTAHSRAASSYSFRSFKEDRNTSVLRAIKGEDPNDDSGSDDSKNPNAKKRKLREDLEAQARARVEQGNQDSESTELLSVIRRYTRRSIVRISSVFDSFDVGSDFGSDDDEESKDGDDAKKNGKKEGNGEDEDGKSKSGRQKWLEFREKICSRKAYTVIVSLLIFFFVVGNVVLIVYVAT